MRILDCVQDSAAKALKRIRREEVENQDDEIMNPTQTQPPMVPSSSSGADICYRHPTVPSALLNAETVLAYFCDQNNPFYDRQCDNESVRMQQGQLSQMSLMDALIRMTGDQYVLCLAQPPLFVICKQRRINANKVTPLCYYYVLDGNIYRAPDLYSLIQSRLVGAVDPLRQAMGEVVKYLRFDPSRGYSWAFDSTPAKHSSEADLNEDADPAHDGGKPLGTGRQKGSRQKEKNDALEDPFNTPATRFQWTHTEGLLKALVEKYPPQGADILPAATAGQQGQSSVGRPTGEAGGGLGAGPSGQQATGTHVTGPASSAPSGPPSTIGVDTNGLTATTPAGFNPLHESSSTSALIAAANAPTPPATLQQQPNSNNGHQQQQRSAQPME